MIGSILLAWLLPAQKEHRVCRISHSIVLVWMVKEEKRTRDSCKAMRKEKGLESSFLTRAQEQGMDMLNHNVVEQPVQYPASPVASQAMLGSEEAGLCTLGCQGNKDETWWNWGHQYCPSRRCSASQGRSWLGSSRVAAGLGVRGAGTNPPLHIVQCCCSEQASQEMKEWETLPAPVTHLLPPHRPGWLLRSRQGDQSSARNPHPSDSGIGIEELP